MQTEFKVTTIPILTLQTTMRHTMLFVVQTIDAERIKENHHAHSNAACTIINTILSGVQIRDAD